MALSAAVDSVRRNAVLVRIQGPDPKGVKMRKHAFHQYNSGKTTLSASGTILPSSFYNRQMARNMVGGSQDFKLVLTVASVIEPFLSLRRRENVNHDEIKLIPGARIDLMIEGISNSEMETPWFPAQLLSLVDVSASSIALQSLIEASPSSKRSGWDVGWSYLSSDYDPHSSVDSSQTKIEHERKLFAKKGHDQVREAYDHTLMAKLATRMAILAVSLPLPDCWDFKISSLLDKGGSLFVVGSPFGILSPAHFFNSISSGSVANCYPPESPTRSLLMADIRFLPGMEGSPVFDELGHLIGIFIRPLRQNSANAEIQLVIPWDEISGCSSLLVKDSCMKGLDGNSSNRNLGVLPNPGLVDDRCAPDGPVHGTHDYEGVVAHSCMLVNQAMSSVCLITIDDGVWASGVVLNDRGLILTNAHLLEPWRFGKANLNASSKADACEELGKSSFTERTDDNKQLARPPMFVPDDVKENKQAYFYGTHGQIRVRLSHLDPHFWCCAKVVYISKGPLDVALIQIESSPEKLCPIIPDFTCPLSGSKIYVVGHGLLGPRCGLPPSISSGVVAKVVKTKMPLFELPVEQGEAELPAMLETTAAVHPGGSGGAVLNAKGHMIGLVTSNARHGRGTMIPHLNFSIPCAVLLPIFIFARDMQDFSILRNLEKPNNDLSSVWTLMPPLPSKQVPSLPSLLEENKREGKGYRFAKFIADNQGKLQNSQTQVGKKNSLRNVITYSKL